MAPPKSPEDLLKAMRWFGVWGLGFRVSGLGFRVTVRFFYSVTLNAWIIKSIVGAPTPRIGHTAVLDPGARMMYVFGGQNTSIGEQFPETTFSDLFGYDLATDTWTELAASSKRSRHAATLAL